MLCNHDYKPWANPSPELAKELGFKTVMMCSKCKKVKKIKKYIKAPVNYDSVVESFVYIKENGKWKLKNTKDIPILDMIEDRSQYNELFLKGGST